MCQLRSQIATLPDLLLFSENSLSEKFPQYNELQVILETLVEKVIVSDDFIKLGSILIHKIAGDVY